MALRERHRSQARERLEALAAAGLDHEEARRAAIEVLRPVVGFERWCWPLTDPGSALSTSGIAEFDLWAEIPRIAALEEHGDVTSKPRLALGPRASTTLSAATGGDLARSTRWRECLRPYGIGDELMTVCRDAHGYWGSVELMRDSDEPPFDDADVAFLDALAPTLGTLLRRSRPRGDDAADAEPPALPPATLVFDPDGVPRSWTPSWRDWIDELSFVPPVVYELSARIRTPEHEATGLPCSARIRTPAGRWATIEGAPLEGAAAGGVAITIREAAVDEVFDLLCRTYAFTRRERQLVALVLDGLATKPLAQALCISPHTVQDHLKAVFGKAGVRTRRELSSRLSGRS